MRSVVFPLARDTYNRHEEQVFRDNARRLLSQSVSTASLFNPNDNRPFFFGQPHAQLIGTDSAFEVASSTLTYCPLPTVMLEHPNLIDSDEIKTRYEMDVEVHANLYHAGEGLGTKIVNYDLYLSVWDGASYTDDYILASTGKERDNNWNLNFTIMFTAEGLKFIRLRVLHDDNVDNTFDLTKSWMSIKQLSMDPVLKDIL